MWDLIISVPDHCLNLYFINPNGYCQSAGNTFQNALVMNS